MKTVFALQEERANLVSQYRSVLDEAGDRDLNGEEQAKLERIDTDIEKLDTAIEAQQASIEARRERLASLEQAAEAVEPQQTVQRASRQPVTEDRPSLDGFATMAEALGSHNRRRSIPQALEALEADEQAALRNQQFGEWLCTGRRTQPLVDYTMKHARQNMEEYAALQMDSDTAGGALIPTEVFLTRFVQGLDEMVFMRQVSTVLPMSMAHSIGLAAEGADPADSDWTAELSTGTLDTAMTVGKRKLRPRDLAKRILVSEKLLRFSSFAENYVRERMLFKMAVTQEKAFLTGSGAGQPLGIFTASADGISTGQDVSTDNTTTNVTADGLINAKYNLASQYLMSANLRWVFHRLVVRNIRKLKDGNGQYLWQPGLGGQPNTLLDTPVIMSEFAPSTFTTGLYVGIIGDFSHYYIADTLTPTMRRLDELHYATNQIGFYIRSETDGMPVLEEAFTRVTLA